VHPNQRVEMYGGQSRASRCSAAGPQSDPVWSETLLFRDLLRSSNGERVHYAELKRSLERDSDSVDEYGELKMPYIRAALKRAGVSPL